MNNNQFALTQRVNKKWAKTVPLQGMLKRYDLEQC